MIDRFRKRAPLLIKRLLDVLVSALLLVLLSPLMALVAILVRLRMGSPVFFLQRRPGLHGEPFTLIKFRTMKDKFNSQGNALSSPERVTPFGRFLRSTSLDELSELWNVLVGDMSLVGPRPLLMSYLPFYSPQQARRHEMKPGLTGYAQIHGRNAIDWDTRLALDVYYVDHWSLRLDLDILLHTIGLVLSRRGVDHSDQVTMPLFMGSDKLEE